MRAFVACDGQVSDNPKQEPPPLLAIDPRHCWSSCSGVYCSVSSLLEDLTMNPHAEIKLSQRRAMSPRRRRCLQLLAAIGCAGVAGPGVVHAAAYPLTIDAMKAARENETRVYYQYVEFGKRARDEGYRGIAYLFLAFAASEQVHASNFGRVLTRLGEELAPLSRPAVSVASTRDNLILAANSEMVSIDGFYPGLLAKISGEKYTDAIDAVQFAWASEKLHRDKIKQIQRWTPSFFDTVARSIDEKTGRYFICQLCGSTVNSIPEGTCPICKNPPTQYRLIEPPS
jgi:rubrerythrin